MCPLDKRRWAPPRNRAQRFSAEFAFAAARAYRCEPTSTTMKSSFLFLSFVFAVTSPSLPAAETKTVDDFRTDRKSTRLNSSHQIISYAVFCLKKKKTKHK